MTTDTPQVKVLSDGLALSDHADGPAICLVAAHRAAASETFIRGHLRHLPAKVHFLYGEREEFHDAEEGQPLRLSGPLLQRGVQAVTRRLRRTPYGIYCQHAVARYLQVHNVRVVLAEFADRGLAVMDACQRAQVPLVVHFHGYDAYSEKALQTKGPRYEELFAKAAAIVVVSRDMKKQLLRLGAPQEKVFINYCGVDLNLFTPAHPELNPPVFLTVGRLTDKKAPTLTLRAFARVRRAHPDARLIFIGDGPLRETCENVAREESIESCVEFRGWQDPSSIADAMHRARAYVLHSITPSSGPNKGDREGTPVSLMEAGACGLPLISTRHGGIPDLIDHGTCGFLCEEGDVDSMANLMQQCANDPDLAARMGAAAHERVRDAFTMEQSITGLWEILQRAASTPATAYSQG